jgi:UDP-glucose 4-epimerase
MRILVTGGAGFIGSHIVDTLQASHEVTAFDNLSTGKQERIQCTLIQGDITNPEDLNKAFEKIKPEIVIHTAAQVMLRESLENPIFDAQQNILGTINVLEACRHHGVKRIIYTSTGGARYGEPERLPVKETDPVNPLAPYGISKHTAEHYVESYDKLYGIDHLILAFGNVYGPRDDPRTKRVMSLFIDALMKHNSPKIFGDGDQTRDFLYVKDIAKTIAANLQNTPQTRLFNLASGESTSVNRIFELVEGELKTGIKPEHVDAVPGEVRDIVLDITKARQELGFIPTTMEQGIKETVAWFQSGSTR